MQAHSEKRQTKKKMMKELGVTGKRLRKIIKKERRRAMDEKI